MDRFSFNGTRGRERTLGGSERKSESGGDGGVGDPLGDDQGGQKSGKRRGGATSDRVGTGRAQRQCIYDMCWWAIACPGIHSI
jgi:hypothetical protein